jgi:hypothetical protein
MKITAQDLIDFLRDCAMEDRFITEIEGIDSRCVHIDGEFNLDEVIRLIEWRLQAKVI